MSLGASGRRKPTGDAPPWVHRQRRMCVRFSTVEGPQVASGYGMTLWRVQLYGSDEHYHNQRGMAVNYSKCGHAPAAEF